MTVRTRPSKYRFLFLVGTIPLWFYASFAAVCIWLLYLRISGQTVRFTPYVFAFVFPLAAGTGLLTAARAGQFDLLLGAGETRSRLWSAAMIVAWLIPSVFVAVVFILSGSSVDRSVLSKVPALLLFAGGLAFASGLVEMRYTLGVLWLLSRAVFLMMIGALERTIALNRGEMPSASALGVMILAAPEMLLERRIPVVWSIGAAAMGFGAILVSYLWFTKADLGGKRS